jgi:hypothetical protein
MAAGPPTRASRRRRRDDPNAGLPDRPHKQSEFVTHFTLLFPNAETVTSQFTALAAHSWDDVTRLNDRDLDNDLPPPPALTAGFAAVNAFLAGNPGPAPTIRAAGHRGVAITADRLLAAWSTLTKASPRLLECDVPAPLASGVPRALMVYEFARYYMSLPGTRRPQRRRLNAPIPADPTAT